MRRLVIRPGAIGDFIVSLPLSNACGPTTWKSGPHAQRAAGSVRRRARARSSPPASTCWASRTRRRASSKSCAASIRSFPGMGRTGRSSASWCARSACHSLSSPRCRPQGAGMHATDFYLEQVSALAECRERPDPAHSVSRRTRDTSPSFILSPEAPARTGRSKSFGNSRWDWSAGCRSAGALGRRIRRFAGAVRVDDLYELACWLAQASLYIGNDSGITHLAAAVGTPVLAIFGPSDPTVWAPRGPHVRIAPWRGGPGIDTMPLNCGQEKPRELSAQQRRTGCATALVNRIGPTLEGA